MLEISKGIILFPLRSLNHPETEPQFSTRGFAVFQDSLVSLLRGEQAKTQALALRHEDKPIPHAMETVLRGLPLNPKPRVL